MMVSLFDKMKKIKKDNILSKASEFIERIRRDQSSFQ